MSTRLIGSYNSGSGIVDLLHSTTTTLTDDVLAFHYGNFDNAYDDGTVGAAAANGRVYADTVPATLPTKFGTIGTPSTASGQTTYTWTPPSTTMNANVLVVAGGGSGGNNKVGTYENGGGGGAGGVVYATDQTLNSASYTIVVGQGGIIPAGNGQTQGKNTTAFGYTALGGGGGSTRDSQTNINGGSGGGAVNWNPNTTNGQATQPGSVSGGFGNDGGTAAQVANTTGGSAGGGGATQVGFNGSGTVGADGGGGILLSIYGETYGQSGWFAGGGAGGGGTGGTGGVGGGGSAGSSSSINGSSGTDHTGGGGGGNFAPDGNAGNGGSGIVLVRYIADNTIVSAKAGVFNYVSSSEYTSTSPTLYSNDTSGDWVTVYDVSNPIRDGGGNIQYTLNNSIDLSGYSYTRVGYLLTHKFPGKSTIDWVLCTFDKWSSTITDLRVPTTVDAFTNQRNVTNLNVYSSNQTAQPNRNNVSGRLEIWSYNYSATQSGLSPAGSNTLFDYDDTSAGNSGYGSFQCHDITNGVTCLAWNNHNSGTPCVGIGNNVSGNPFYDSSGHLDWTFADNYNSDFNLKIMVM